MNKQHVRDHVAKMVSAESTQIAGFVVDLFCTPMMDVAAEFGLPSYVFFTSNAAVLGLMFHLETLSRDEKRDITELKDSDTELEIPGFVNPVPAKVLPSMLVDKQSGSAIFINIAKRFRESKGIIVNTFAELESNAVRSLAEDGNVPPVYPVGPVIHLVNNENEEEAMKIMRWLDDQPPLSVVFLCFGSMGISSPLVSPFRTCRTGEEVRAQIEGDSTSPRAKWPPDLVLDYKKDFRSDNTKVMLVIAKEIENGIRKLMEGWNECGEDIKQRVKEMSEKSKVAVVDRWSSYNFVGLLIEDFMNNMHTYAFRE
ncbi:hypothetical protein RHGRI_010261 [Rhododendron griersonianum]|uniref:Uncharacterized protein n=1 Tax=Rhododendron griersonianum TaxID=479676 RepID=A0AAV6KHT2_9ERIC|nr:hypothetical protein RHGRI_010261 [Rhododendron griersonianum]